MPTVNNKMINIQIIQITEIQIKVRATIPLDAFAGSTERVSCETPAEHTCIHNNKNNNNKNKIKIIITRYMFKRTQSLSNAFL